MNRRYTELVAELENGFASGITLVESCVGEATVEVAKEQLLEVANRLRDEFGFELLVDLCGVDYLEFGESEWKTRSATDSGFSRGVERHVIVPDADTQFDEKRFAVVYHLLSIRRNLRLRLRVFCGQANPPRYLRWWRCGAVPIGMNVKLMICLASCFLVIRICGGFLPTTVLSGTHSAKIFR